MTRQRGIKQEPTRLVTPPSPTVPRSALSSSMPNQAMTASAGQQQLRSGAPSVDTRFAQQGLVHDESDDDCEVLMMEVRPRVKSSSDGVVLPQLQSPPDQSFISQGFTVIGDKLKQLNDTLGELQTLGIQQDVTSLPEMVLVGDQSAGKSSLMSAFCGLYLPRSEGACTKCPVHIRLSRSSTWSCKISLQQDYAYRPGESGRVRVSKKQPFGPWFEQPRVVKEFISFDNDGPETAEAIERALRWAQIAILNPNHDHNAYKPGAGRMWKQLSLEVAEDHTEAPFSPNVVALSLSGPTQPDLSFYDLPGVFIAPKRDGEQYLVDLVQNLAAKYIAHEQAIILWAVPMNADPETSFTLSIIRQKNAQERTVGVMTKADLLPPGSHNQWLSMLRSEQHIVGRGYFITARPSGLRDRYADHMLRKPTQRDDPFPDDLARQAAFEEGFFNRALPPIPGGGGIDWSDKFKDFEERCGVNRLTVFVSHQLGKEFARRLPMIKEKISKRLLDVEFDLSKLPDLPNNPEVEIRRRLFNFAADTKAALESTAFSAAWGGIAESFRQDVLSLKPKYVVKLDAPLKVDAMGRIDLTADDDGASQRSSPASATPQNRHRSFDEFADGMGQADGTPASKRGRYSNNINNNMIKRENGGSGGSGSASALLFSTPLRPSIALPRTARPRAKTLQDIRVLIETKSKPGMPGLVADDVYNSLCMEAVATWSTPLASLLQKTEKVLHDQIRHTLLEAFDGHHERRVYKDAAAALSRFVKERMEDIEGTLAHLYRIETTKFYTLDKDSLARHEAAESRFINRVRHFYRWKAGLGAKGADLKLTPWETMTEDERATEEARMSKEAQKLGPDPFKVELGVCGYVRGYYLTAASRFVDQASLYIFSGLMPSIVEEIKHHYLDRQLGVEESNNAQLFDDLMIEDVETTQRRQKLKNDRARFRGAIEKIESLDTQTSSGSASTSTPSRVRHPLRSIVDNEMEDDIMSGTGGY